MSNVVYKSPGNWLTVKEHDGYFFSERKGMDSIAIVPCRMVGEGVEVYIHEEVCPAHLHYRKTNQGAIGGSIDKDLSPIEIAKRELREEAGFDCSIDKIVSMGIMFASTQSNENVHLFIADVTGITQQKPQLEPGEVGFVLGGKFVPFSEELFMEIPDPRWIVAMSRMIATQEVE